MTRPRAGFTLVELLVVIAILSVLMALLLPAVRRARAVARSTQCMSHVKQLAVAFQQYAEAHDGELPWAWNAGADLTEVDGIYGGSNWAGLVYPYLENLDVYVCPDYPRRGRVYLGQASTGTSYILRPNYRANPSIGYDRGWYGPGILRADQMLGSIPHASGNTDQANWTHHPARMVRITGPSRKICLFDTKEHDWMPYIPTPGTGRLYFIDTLGDGDRTNDANYAPWWGKTSIGAWHLGYSNFAFFDGHTERVHWTHEKSFATVDAPGGYQDELEDRYWSLAH